VNAGARVLDELRVRGVLERYCALLDAGEIDELLTLFDDDCTFAMMGRTYEGKAAFATVWDRVTPTERLTVQHALFNPIVSIDGDRATSVSGWAMLDRGGEGGRVRIAMTGRYHDALQRCSDGKWRFTSRRAETLARPESSSS